MKTIVRIALLLFVCITWPVAALQGAALDIATLESVITEEMKAWGIGGVTVALVDDQEIIYSKGFGEAHEDSIFRVGSISKLFNAIAVMQQVERGELDLDEPLPSDVLPINPFPDNPAVTLRQILCHRSGLQREPPVGGYLDPTEPDIAATVASVNRCVLVTRPGEMTRYSNLGPTIAGLLVERASGQSFADYQNEHLLEPLGMESSAWTTDTVDRDRLIVSHMRVADGEGGWNRREAPVFDLGTLPAGNLFSTAKDLARFTSALLAGGKGLVEPENLAQMWKPQVQDAEEGFGIGFYIGSFREHRSIGHSGAVYGHSTNLRILPEEKLAAVVLANEDIASGRVGRMTDAALSCLLEYKMGEAPPGEPEPYGIEDLTEYAGHYESESYWARIEVKEGILVGDLSGQPTRFTPVDQMEFRADNRITHGGTATFRRNEEGEIEGFKLGSQSYKRVPEADRTELPLEWKKYLGVYGHDFIPLIVSERYGHLYVMTENMVEYRLTPVNRQVCELPPGMYVEEEAVFLTDTEGKVIGINFANMIFEKQI